MSYVVWAATIAIVRTTHMFMSWGKCVCRSSASGPTAHCVRSVHWICFETMQRWHNGRMHVTYLLNITHKHAPLFNFEIKPNTLGSRSLRHTIGIWHYTLCNISATRFTQKLIVARGTLPASAAARCRDNYYVRFSSRTRGRERGERTVSECQRDVVAFYINANSRNSKSTGCFCRDRDQRQFEISLKLAFIVNKKQQKQEEPLMMGRFIGRRKWLNTWAIRVY